MVGGLVGVVAALLVLKSCERGSGPVDISDVEVAAPDLGVDIPDVSLPDIDVPGPDVDVPDIDIDTYDDGDGYSFIARNVNRSPVRYDPCSSITYVVRPGGGPPDAVAFVEQAVGEMEDATGIEFSFQGTTDEIPETFDDIASGEVGDADVWIGWAQVDQSELLPDDDSAAGVGGSSFGQAGRLVNRGEYTSGFAIIDEENDASLDFGPGFSLGNLLLHELGHVVGLGHVDNESQLMNPTLGGQPLRGFQDGDLEGLRRLGEGGCL